jgi:hypothetical protein
MTPSRTALASRRYPGPATARWLQALVSCAGLMAALVGAPAAAAPVTYTETVLNTTRADWSQIALGSLRFDHSYTYVTFTFTGDTDDVRPYSISGTSGYVIDQGSATVRIRDVTNDITVTATFDPGEIYVGTDITNGGYGFGSRIYPIYPYALLPTVNDDLSSPEFDLRHDLLLPDLHFGISCVSIASSCLNKTAADAANYPLHTDLGDFWITWQGITSAVFAVDVQEDVVAVPEPAGLALALAALGAMAGATVRSRRRRRWC